MTDTHSPVTLVGAGIGGLALAIGLASRGVACRVLERRDALPTTGSGLVLSPNGVHALRALDAELGRRVESLGHVDTGDSPFPFLKHDGAVTGTMRSAQMLERYGAPMVSVMRADLLAALAERAAELGVDVELGRGIDRVELDPVGRPALDGRALDGVLVGADGVHSRVRRAVTPTPQARPMRVVAVRGVTRDVPGPYGPTGMLTTGVGAQLFASPIGPRDLYWVATLNGRQTEGALDDARARMADWHAPIPDMLARVDPESVVVDELVVQKVARVWARERVVLIGDAAHATTPFIGQGANLALEDAAYLAHRWAGHADLGELFAAFARERRARCVRVVKMSLMMGRMGQLERWPARKARDLMMRMMMRSNPSDASGNDWLFGYRAAS